TFLPVFDKEEALDQSPFAQILHKRFDSIEQKRILITGIKYMQSDPGSSHLFLLSSSLFPGQTHSHTTVPAVSTRADPERATFRKAPKFASNRAPALPAVSPRRNSQNRGTVAYSCASADRCSLLSLVEPVFSARRRLY